MYILHAFMCDRLIGDIMISYMFQAAEESEVAAASNAGEEATGRSQRTNPGDTPSVQLPSAVGPSSSTADNASTLASLRIVR